MIQLLLVDDHTIFRAGIKVLLEMQPDFKVVGEAEDGAKALALVRELQPEVVLMDIAMPGVDGLSSARQIIETAPSTKIILLTQHENKEYIQPALKIGAKGYVLKRAAADELVMAIRAVHQGKSFLDSNVTSTILADYCLDGKKSTETNSIQLSEREREILVMLARGYSNRQIAELLKISPKTVDFHCARIMKKLGIKGRVALAQYALRHGFVE
ncbi:response regulator containing a CheY-like receiver domain and an HTH DNA-binding domain [Desulfosporosinus acidiphilus SJ4]|uniref:Stage 0 sporulation protein A homolog n=1 Tax=Desulfosporosinus acidiphilus (strain DSM 22704 / JCM 16185 / SJ4) TaxID=646529 RepID=I4D9K9_DESAJ|nr:response regulator transcription factor [Desulfosporosinus acidiphilus]AFM42483.1 response regulator containing a CheY-like receiver domain and an HTH DNA-binding domain [Desulfosporosinus acidiphilus SJ4]